MEQNFDNYTEEDLNVWSFLFKRQHENLKDKASSDYIQALNNMSEVLNMNELPDFKKINKWFADKTQWQIECVPGIIPVDEFFNMLAEKKFPSSTWLRSIDKLDYLEEPDMFHDIFGHIPLLSNPSYSEFMNQFGKIGQRFIYNEEKLLMLQRLYWFTIEFGLIKEQDQNKIYGAGIISSYGESIECIKSKEIEHFEFDMDRIINTVICISEMQPYYFIIENLIQLNKSFDKLILKWEENEMGS